MFQKFLKALEGWMSVTGMDFCPICYKENVSNLGEHLEASSLDEKKTASSRKGADGWFVMCEGLYIDGVGLSARWNLCPRGAQIFVPCA